MTDLERAVTDTADPPSEEARPQSHAPPKRPWWKTRVTAAGAGAVLAAIAIGGYFGANALLSHPSSPSASGGLEQVHGLPPGAVNCESVRTDVGPFNAGARGTPATTCEFVEQVSMAYSRHVPTPGPDLLTVLSPATSKSYNLVCVSMGGYATCTGGAAAVIYLYNK